MKKRHNLSILLTSLLLTSSNLFAFTLNGSDQDKGMAIAKESDLRDQGWTDSISEMKMTLRNRTGDESVRELRISNLEIANDGDKSLTVFDSPKDVRGTGFLSFSHIDEADDQWLYLPALKRVKRIASKNKSGPFMGSEFSFEDLSSFEVDKYNYRYLGEETVNGIVSYKVEMTPRYKHSGYTRLVTWIGQKEFRIQQIQFYDRKKSLLKTQAFKDYRHYLGQYWRAHTMEMSNHQTGKFTKLEFDNIKFQTGLSEQTFKKNALKRSR
mgnify:FL=1